MAAVEFGFLFGGVVVIEDIFRLPGIGSLVLVGIINRDYPVLLAGALAITVFVLIVNMIVDIVRRPARSAPASRGARHDDAVALVRLAALAAGADRRR